MMRSSMAILALALFACSSSSPITLSGSSYDVSYRVTPSEPVEQDNQKAEEYCRRLNKRAGEPSISHDGDATLAHYRCQ